MRSFPFFVARRLSGYRRGDSSATDKMVRFAIVGIALCVAVMLLTIFIGKGFNHEVKKRLSYLTGDIKLSPVSSSSEGGASFFYFTPAMREKLLALPQIEDVRPVVQLPGLIKTDSAFQGVVALGFDSETIASLEGSLLSSTKEEHRMAKEPSHAILSSPSAKELQLAEGDKFAFYSLGEAHSLRILTLAGTSDMPEVAGGILTLPINYLQRQAGLAEDEVSYVELFIKPHLSAELVADELVAVLSQSDFSEGQHLALNTSRELMPALFDWVDMLDSNTLLLLSIMAVVAGFTSITGILVLILGRTRMIGVLKALGASARSLRELFLILGGYIALWGLFWGNLIAFFFALLQKWGHIIPLDPATYYISYVPISFSWQGWLVVNLAAWLVILLMIYLPTQIVARIRAVDTLRFS